MLSFSVPSCVILMSEFFLHNILLRFLTCTISSHMFLLRVGMVLYAEETLKWRNITVAAYIACIALGIYTFAGEEHHEASERQVMLQLTSDRDWWHKDRED